MYYSNWYGMDTENDKNGVVTLCALASEHGDMDVWEGAGHFRKWCDANTDEAPVVVCHNLEYDLVNEFGKFYPYLNLTYLKGRLIMAQYGDVKFLDSFNHYRMPLKKVGEPFGLTKGKFDIHSKEYVAMDAFIPVKAMTFTRDYLLTLGGEIGATAGSSAMSVWMVMTGGEFLTGPFDTPWLRQGYAGGRTEIFRRHTEGELLYHGNGKPVMVPKTNFSKAEREALLHADTLNNQITNEDARPSKPVELEQDRKDSIIGYDINSCFPFCMLSEFPMVCNDDPQLSKTKGMAEVTITVPTDMYVGPLFWRDSHDRLVYPVGRFKGIWTYDEIRFAESLGCRVQKVHKAIGSNYCERPFDEFILTIYKKRKESKNASEREVLKVVMNSLYGKLASKSTITRVVSKHTMLKSGSKRITDVQWIDHNRGLLDFHTPQPRYVNVLWGAMVTANARILLTKYLIQVPPEKLIYCDTDSVYVNDFELPLSTDLGGMKLEKRAKIMTVLQPKAYRLDDFYRAKGIPRPKMGDNGQILIDYAKAYMEDGMAEFEAPIRFRESLRRADVQKGLAGPNSWVPRHKARKTEYSAKKLFNQRYFPPVIGEQQELFPDANLTGKKR